MCQIETAGVGVALVTLVGADGSPGWRIARAVAVIAVSVLVMAVHRRAAPRWSGRLAVATGILVLASGAGFVPHLVKRGSVPLSVAAVLSTGGGIALVLTGLARLGRGRARLRRTVNAVAVLPTLAVAAMVMTPSVMATNVPRPSIGAGPSSRDLEYESVELTARDGTPLAGWYVPSEDGAAIVLLHGAGSTRSNVLDHAAVLAEHGFGVLMVDARGHDESGGRAMDFGWLGDEDIAAATAFLEDRSEVDRTRIGLVGLSMGGEEAIGAAARNPLVRAVVAEGATARIAADETWLSERYGVRGWVQEQVERAQDVVTDLLTAASPPISLESAVRAATSTDFLLIAGGEVSDEVHAARDIAKAAPARVEVWIVNGAGHTEGLRRSPTAWEARVVAFLERAFSTR